MNRLTDLYIDGKILKEKYNLEFEKLNAELKIANNLEKKEQVDLNKFKELMQIDIMNIYNKLNGQNKRAFWAHYIEYIIKNEDNSYHIEFKKDYIEY